jgi:ribonuclease BN (tRNA processing enzyme)
MKLTVLGCSGGIARGARTTALLLDDDILIDAGSGVGDLELAQLRRIDHVFVTHSHLDHVTALPLMLDTVGADRDEPVTVHGQEATLDALRRHVFNDVMWPDFSRIPSPERPFLRYQVLAVGAERIQGERRIRSIPVSHVVPAVGYLVSGPTGGIAFSGDTTVTDEFWRVLNACADLRHVIIETSFLDEECELARVSQHLCPSMLAGELRKLKAGPQVHISHLMPGHEDATMDEIARHLPDRLPRRLARGQTIEL